MDVLLLRFAKQTIVSLTNTSLPIYPCLTNFQDHSQDFDISKLQNHYLRKINNVCELPFLSYVTKTGMLHIIFGTHSIVI